MPTPDAAQLFTDAPNHFYTLLLCPDKAMEMRQDFELLVAPLGQRFRSKLLTGDSRGATGFTFKFSSLPATVSNSLTLDDETTVSKALYFSLFCQWHVAHGKPFYIKHPLTLIDILVDFVGTGYRMQRSAQNDFLWSGEIECVEFESPDLMAMTDEFSGSGQNPQQI